MYPKPDRIIPALYGGIIMMVLMVVPGLNFINCLCCAGLLLGGFGGVFFYKSEFTPDTPPFTSGDCMAVGAMAGVVGAIGSTIASSVIVAMFGNYSIDYLLQWIEQSGLQMPEEYLEMIRQAQEQGVTFFSFIGDLLLALVIYPIFGMLGGLIGYAAYKPKPGMVHPPPPEQQTM